MRRVSRLIKLCVLTLALTLPTQAMAGSLTISAAASLTNAFTEVKEAFIKANPGTEITTNFAASNPLLRQIQEGAPVDIFASADQKTMNDAEEGKFIDKATRIDFAANKLVLIVPGGEKSDVKNTDSLTAKTVTHIAIGNPDSVPAGRYTKEVLGEKFDGLKDKYIMGESVRQVLDYVSRGEVQAGFVYKTDAKQAGDKVVIIEELEGKTPVLYPIAVLKDSKEPALAKKFIDFVTSKEGDVIMSKYGFSKP